MKIALDPYMHRHLSLEAIAKKTAELGYDYIELSPRADFFDWWVMPRAYPERVRQFQRAMKAAAAFHLRIDRRMVVQILPVVNRSPLNLVDRSVDLFDGVLFFLIHVIGGGQVFQMSARMPQVGKRVQVCRMPSRLVSEGERGADSHKKRE